MELGEEWGVWKVIRKDVTQFGGIHKNKKDAEFTLSICSWSNCQVVFEKMTPRKMLQQVGTDLFRNQLHPDIWTNATFANYQNDNWILTDMRFPNEAQAIKDRGGIIIRVERPNLLNNQNNINLEHISEKSLDDYKFNYYICNDSSIANLIEQIKNILIKERLL